MVESTHATQVVVFTHDYSITGSISLNDRRLSDFLNDKRDTFIYLRNVSIARMEEPAKVLEKTITSVIPKSGIVLVFEPPQGSATPTVRKLMKYPKSKYDVFVATDGLEIHGHLNQSGPLDLQQAVMGASESFIPITEATVTFKVNPSFVLRQEAVLVNVKRLRLMGELNQSGK
jgi:hypothetical protein